MRIVFLDQADFPGAPPFLDAFFAQDGIGHGVVRLKMDELFDAVSIGETGNITHPVLVYALAQIAGDADIERAVRATCKDVNERLLHAGRLAQLLVVVCGFCGACGSGSPPSRG
jgi:hypothetical protein